MNRSQRTIRWTPRTVSWMSLAIMGLVVAGIGLSGTAYVVGYLHERPDVLEPVGERRQLRWVNDSKATNVASALAALAAMWGPFVLLAVMGLQQQVLHVLNGVVRLADVAGQEPRERIAKRSFDAEGRAVTALY